MKRTRVPPRNLPATSSNILPLPAPIPPEPKIEPGRELTLGLMPFIVASVAFWGMVGWGAWTLAAVIVPASR